ncbi:metal-dependent transcriptional regulator [Pseudoclavibacter chungangensis]|uniref:Metal-dependent transcriptional regulator n=1 Tax=Pseudoclavibacter chungangensis TaxID=587635 RepID=A0A7J5C0E3_9MICO|nr:metal-dependent transcriptional regulator [Pseudoclavibacter chungangensis]KAB1660374.1 metal-dependent transcriptional regulator [Pseudoclavibacter chungangensis]NYJ65736.1 DtxR family Mn-dependent transcriptional regulator [Pseudoclavibacter chungangensis]
MTNLVDTTEMYLRTILDLEEEGIVPLRARISERLGHSGPTVSQTVARMERDGLVEVAPDRRLVLTRDGRAKAIRVLRKHRIAEGLLAKVIGLDLAIVHDEACRWEHVMSDEAERRIFELLDRPNESPYGTPIPGLDEFGAEPADAFLDGVVDLATALAGAIESGRDHVDAVIRRLGEPVQSDMPTLRLLDDAGLMPGAKVRASRAGGRISVAVEGTDEQIELPDALAEHVYVLGDA